MEQKCYRSELVGLLGYPVDENPTVVTIEAALKALGRDGRYITMEVKPENLGAAIAGLKATSFLGTHITVPHKVAVLQYLDELSDSAALIGAVNTVYFRNGKVYGENTDGKGFLTALEKAGIAPEGKRVVVLGAGGAARAICVELATHGAAQITVVNRSENHGQALVKLLNEKTGIKAVYQKWEDAAVLPPQTDLLVQATNIGLYPDSNSPSIAWDSLDSRTTVCDIIPNPVDTAFLQRARQQGCRTLAGFDMLIYQGMISFRIWFGVEPSEQAMRQALAAEYEEPVKED